MGHRAYEYGEKHQGYFTWAIAQALRGYAANDRGEVTLGGLVKYIETTVPKLVAIDYGAKVKQKPFANIEGYRADELVLSMASRTNLANLTDASKESVQSDNVVITPPAGTKILVKGTKSQKVIYSHGIYSDKHSDQEIRELSGLLNEFNLILVSSLEKAGLTVIRREQLSERDLQQLDGMTRIISVTKVPQSKSLPASVYISVSLGLRDLPANGGLYTSVSLATVRLIDLDEGRTIAVEEIGEKSGFGGTQEQARRNALREVGVSVPAAFIVKVREQAW